MNEEEKFEDDELTEYACISRYGDFYEWKRDGDIFTSMFNTDYMGVTWKDADTIMGVDMPGGLLRGEMLCVGDYFFGRNVDSIEIVDNKIKLCTTLR